MKNPIYYGLVVIGALVVGACTSEPGPAARDYVRFAAPTAGATLSGLVDVHLEIAIPESARALEFGVEGQPLTTLPSPANTLRVDTRRFENGERKLIATVTGDSGQQWSGSVAVQIRNPDFSLTAYSLNEASFYGGRTVKLQLQYSFAGLSLVSDFAAIDDQFDPLGVITRDLGGGDYEVSYTLSKLDAVPPGQYDITLKAANGASPIAVSKIPVRLRAKPPLPITVESGLFIDSDVVPVSASNQSVPSVTQIDGPSQLVSGLPQVLQVQWVQPESERADRLFIRASGYSGYYVVPIAGLASQASIPINLQFAQIGSDTNHGTLDLSVAVANGLGAIQEWTAYPMLYHLLSPYGAHATLSWNSAADLDLKVTTPSGAKVGYGSRSVEGGTLELDANGLCAKSPIAAERISWAPGDIGPGRYQVSADIYDACDSSGADYTAVLFFCGKTQTFSGHFSAADVETEARTRPIATVDVDCVNHLYGTVSFERVYEFSVRSPNDRAAFVPIRAVSTLDGGTTVLAETTTDRVGNYSMYLPAGTGQNYFLEVEASYTPTGQSTPFVRVMPKGAGAPHLFKIPGLDTSKRLDTEQNVLVKVADGSGALNIIARIEQAYAWMTANFNAADARKVTPVEVRWSLGEDSSVPSAAPGQNSANTPIRSYWFGDVIHIGGLPYDINEQDDPVIVHEFFHHVWSHLGIPIAGGSHTFSERTFPALALSEATATALGQQALADPVYSDTYGPMVIKVDLENRRLPDSAVRGADQGTADDTMSGNVNEFLVAAVIWDLMDPLGGQQEPTDQIDSTYDATLGAVAHYLPLTNRADRGAVGPDLVDLLDGWRCRRTNPIDDVRLKTLLDERRFNYDFFWFACP